MIALVAIIGLLVYSSIPDTTLGGTFKTYAMFHDGSRMSPGSPVVIAGVRVGDVTKLSIEGRLARVDIALQEGIKLPAETTFATRRADSLFGDSYVEIIPGPEEPGQRFLKSGEPIPHVEEGASTDRLLRSIERALPKIDSALDTVHEVMVDGRPFVQGPVRQRIEAADRWLAEGKIERPLSRADRALETMEDGTRAAAEAVASNRNLPDRMDGWNASILDARKAMADAQVRIVEAFQDAREGMDRIDGPVQRYAEVVSAINRGEGDDWRGTLGTLVNDPELADDIEDVTESLKESTAGFDRFKTWLGARVELNYYTRSFRVYATAEIRARNDKFYLLEIERSGLGPHEDSLSDAPGTDSFTRREVIYDRQRITLQFGKRIGFMQFRAGIKDSTFGAGTDLLFMEGRLRLSADVFGSFYRTPRVKLAAAFAVWRTLYILGGIDDALNPHAELPIETGNTPVPGFYQTLHYGRDYFVGAALQFDEQDLMMLLRLYGAMLVGLI